MTQPFLPLLYSTLVSPPQVGLLVSVGPILSIAAGPAAATAADLFDCHRAIMVGSLALGAVLWLPLLLPDLGFAPLLLLALLQALLGGKSGSILDASTVDAVGPRYGKIRLWGAVGFGICSLAGGALIEAAGDDAPFRWMLLCSVAMGLLAAAAISLVAVDGLRRHSKQPGAASAAEQDKQQEGEGGGNQQDGGGGGLRELQATLLTARVLVFLLIVFLSGVASGLIDTFLYVHLDALGGAGTLMGLARFITCAAEVPFFRMAEGLMERFGVLGVLALAQFAYVCRMVWYASLAPSTVLWVLPCEVLHGLTFAALWSDPSAFCSTVPSISFRQTRFYQDRLGTNTMKTHKKRCRFQVGMLQQCRKDCPAGSQGQHARGRWRSVVLHLIPHAHSPLPPVHPIVSITSIKTLNETTDQCRASFVCLCVCGWMDGQVCTGDSVLAPVRR